LHAIYRLESRDELSSALKNSNPCSNLHDTTINGLRIFSLRDVPSDTGAIFNSPQFSNLIDEMANGADLVNMHSPQVLAVTDATIMATKAVMPC